MVLLHVKNRDESQFLFETRVTTPTHTLLAELLEIYNGRLKIGRICAEFEQLAEHGTHLPPNMVGLTEEQLDELKLTDDWGDKCVPSGGFTESKDPMSRRNGKKPQPAMCDLITKTVEEVKEAISKKLVEQGKTLTKKEVLQQLELLKGCCMIIYPMGLPPHEPIRMELEYTEELGGTQDSLQVLGRSESELWFCGKQIFTEGSHQLQDFIGKNEKTKVVVKLQRKGSGPPGREPLMTEEEQKNMMMYAYRREQEYKKLEEDEDDSHLDSSWADKAQLKRQFHGLSNIGWRPK